jgi:hypothetical protein
VVAGQLLLAPAVLVLASGLVLAGRLGRWRPGWLALPGTAGVGWLLAVGPSGSAAGFVAGSVHMAGLLGRAAARPGWLLHPSVLANAARWQDGGLPLALLIGTAEAAAVLWPYWRRPGIRWRRSPGAAVRCRAAAARLAAGRTATRDGCAIGWQAMTGRPAGFSWAEAAHGVLLTGPDSSHLDQLAAAVACAAIRRRMSVILIQAGGTLELAAAVADLARAAGVRVAAGRSPLTAAIGRAIRGREVVVLSAGLPAGGAAGARAAGAGAAGAGAAGGGSAGGGSAGAGAAGAGAAAEREAASDAVRVLLGVLGDLRALGLRADCLACVSVCDGVEPRLLAELLQLGPATGTAVILSTTSATTTAGLAPVAGVTAFSHHVPGDGKSRDPFAGGASVAGPGLGGPGPGSAHRPRPRASELSTGTGWFSLHVRAGRPRLMHDCRSVAVAPSAGLAGPAGAGPAGAGPAGAGESVPAGRSGRP